VRLEKLGVLEQRHKAVLEVPPPATLRAVAVNARVRRCAGQAGRVYDQWRSCVGVEMAALIEGSASVLSGCPLTLGGLEFPWLKSGNR
jgi:hypothetical protein